MDACCRLLSPLEETLQDYVLADGKLHADDMPVLMLLPSNRKTKAGEGTYFSDDHNGCVVRLHPGQKSIHQQIYLTTFNDVLQADAYAGLNELYRGRRMTEAACWPHRPQQDPRCARPHPVSLD